MFLRLWPIFFYFIYCSGIARTDKCPCQKPCSSKASKCVCPNKCAAPKQLNLEHVKEREAHKRLSSTTPPILGKSQTICNSERLRRILLKTIGDDSISTKKIVQIIAERSFHGPYNVICAQGNFSYITNTDEYCQAAVKGRTCYIFKRHAKDIKANKMINFF